MDTPSVSGMNVSTSTSTCNTYSPSKIPVRTCKRSLPTHTQEPKVKLLKLLPLNVVEPIVQISEDEIYAQEFVPQCNQVQDIKTFFKRFQDFYTKMLSLNQTMYFCLGLHEDYERIEKHLTGFLGELHYYREKEDAINSFYRYSSEQD